MRINKIAIYVLTPITIISFVLALLLHILCVGCEFVINTLQGVFCSSLLALIMAIIGYFVERRKTLEKFWTYGHKIMRNYGKYHYEMSIEEKMNAGCSNSLPIPLCRFEASVPFSSYPSYR